jgi:hypothetical protein
MHNKMIEEVNEMYQLYINEGTLELKVSRISATLKDVCISMLKDKNGDEILNYNKYYKISKSRRALMMLAWKIKDEWLKQATERVERIKAIEI